MSFIHLKVILFISSILHCLQDRCTCYWPKIAHVKNYGKIRVQALSEDKGQYYILREFCLTKENRSAKYVSQYHFTSWPSKGIPDNSDSVLTLVREIGQHYKYVKESKMGNGPIVIHCNNGIGRTGSLIAIDIIIDVLRTKGMASHLMLRPHNENQCMLQMLYNSILACHL